MKKKLLGIISIVVLIVIALSVLSGCASTFKQKAIATDFNDLTVTSNGGLAVGVGNYVYFINGAAGQEGYNNWGQTVKGAIMRVELDAQKNPISNTLKTIIPKNVHGTKKTGLVVLGDRIFFTSPSVNTDGKGKPLTGRMVLLSAKLDGTDIKVIREFKNYDVDYKITNNGFVLYIEGGKLYSLNLSKRKPKPQEIDKEISSFKFMEYATQRDSVFNNTIIYVKASDKATDKFNVIWGYTAGGEKKEIFNGNPQGSYKGKAVEDVNGYSLELVQLVYASKDTLRLVYNKSDSGSSMSTGTYSYDFSQAYSFDWKKEVRYSISSKFTDLRFIGTSEEIKQGKFVLATKDDGLYYSPKSAKADEFNRLYSLETPQARVVEASSIKVLEIIQGNNISVRYLTSEKVNNKAILSTTADGFEALPLNQDLYLVFNKSVDSEWLPLDVVHQGKYYFFNKDVSKNIYWYDADLVIKKDERTMFANKLGKFSQADELAMLEAPPEENEE